MSISLNNISKKYSNFYALKNITALIKKNKINSIVGINGSGKTTLVKCISTLLLHDEGEIFFDDTQYITRNLKTIRNKISLLLDGSRNLYLNLTLIQNIKYFLAINKTSYKGKEELINKYLQKFELLNHKNNLVSTLSRGMQQKTSLIIALAQDSELLILDEPNLGLDFESLLVLKQILREEISNRTVILTTQDTKLIEDISDYIFVLHNGTLKYAANMGNCNNESRKLFLSIALIPNVSDELIKKILGLSANVKFYYNKIIGEFQKDSIDDIIRIIQGLNYKIVDMQTKGTFETNLTTILNSESEVYNG